VQSGHRCQRATHFADRIAQQKNHGDAKIDEKGLHSLAAKIDSEAFEWNQCNPGKLPEFS
jgi:hypothetical protein